MSTPSRTPSPEPPLSAPDTLAILLTQLPTFSESRYQQYGPLCAHPNASCAFATFPPVPRLAFHDERGDPFLLVENPDGCTILDVNRALAQLIPHDDYHVGAALTHYRDLALATGMLLSQWAEIIMREKGFLSDHEYMFLEHLISQE